MAVLDDIFKATQAGNHKDIKDLVKKALDSGIEAEKIVKDALARAMVDVGDKFGSG